MKLNKILAPTAALLAAASVPAFCADQSITLNYETPAEFFGRGDFDGDGRLDIVILDKATGKYRLGYQMPDGTWNWVDNRPSGIKPVTGFSVGRVTSPKNDGLAFTSPDANQVTMVDVSAPNTPTQPVIVPFTAALGPSMVSILDIGGEGNTPLGDLYVGSIYNSPDANLATLLRNDEKEFPKLSEETLPGVAGHANHLRLTSTAPELLCFLVAGDKADTFRAEDLSSGKPVAVASADNLPSGADYTIGHFHGPATFDALFYKPGGSKFSIETMDQPGGKLQLGKAVEFDLGQPFQRLIPLGSGTAQKLAAILGQGEKLGVFDFDGTKSPALVQTIIITNELVTFVADAPGGCVVFSQPSGSKYTTRYQMFSSGTSGYAAGVFGTLPNLLDNDNVTIPEIYSRIASKNTVTAEAQMKPYTNTIPGTKVTFAMVPIPGGEYVMGSPASEAGRKADEGPQHKVKIEPFWMEEFEITWNEYELFMYPDEERTTRATQATDSSADKIADIVTHPSRPYVEMSFGMGKNGFPAISMTQHGANKYCQWLSAKTGEFYRLPTEAEWEYAARAGTTTAYFFGDDASKLGEYAWFEQNSDFKYQKVGKKKPNPWGLYDIYGNVTEWVLDQYDPGYYEVCAKQPVSIEPWNKATKPYPHAVRGGSWDDEAGLCRSAARRGSDKAWKMQDPQLPKSTWFFTDAQFVGFRIVRPLKIPTADQMQKYWTSGVERD
jgi:formylglycine-generating enzyme required for sulfatase activity